MQNNKGVPAMKKYLYLMIVSALMLFNVSVLANDEITVKINNEPIQFDVAPQIINGTTMVPMRQIFEKFGYDVYWNPEDQTIFACLNDTFIHMTINSANMYFGNGIDYIEKNLVSTVSLDVPPMIINDRTLVPIRAISEVSNYDINWDEALKTISIKKPMEENTSDIIVDNLTIHNLTESYKNTLAQFNKLDNEYDNNGRYCIYDIDQNGTPELVIKSGASEASYQYTYYTYNHGIVKIDSTTAWHSSLHQSPFKKGLIESVVYNNGQDINFVSINNNGSGLLVKSIPISKDKIFYNDIKYIVNNEMSMMDYQPVNDDTPLYAYFNPTKYQDYYDATNEFNQVNEYINAGSFLEAQSLCDSVLTNYNLSKEDKELFNSLRNTASTEYNKYVSELNKYKTYKIPDWGMSYKFLNGYEPTFTNGIDSFIQDVLIYISRDSLGEVNGSISLESYKVGDDIDINTVATTPRDYISWYTTFIYQSSLEGWNLGTNFELLSESDTTIAGFPTRQCTTRITEYTNRYHTEGLYQLNRCYAFQYGDWIYIIEAVYDDYEWSDDFWNKMEMVVNSIEFY